MIEGWSGSSPVWKEGADLHLPQSMVPLWRVVKASLENSGISRTGTKDRLLWSLQNHVSVRHIYADMISASIGSPPLIFPPCFWKAACPLKMIIFSWLLFENKILTWEILQKRSWQGPSRCSMCHNDGESNLHMFFQCPSSLHIWYVLSLHFGFPYNLFSSVQEGFKWWSRQSTSWISLFIISCWFMWNWRNAHIFQSSKEPLQAILQRILACHDFYHQEVSLLNMSST